MKNEFDNEQKNNHELQIKIQDLEKQLEDEQKQNQELQARMKEIESVLADRQKHNQELQRELEIRIEEAQQKIKDLQRELEKAERREIYFEEMHNNYMMQVQTLINQKQILAPGAKKILVEILVILKALSYIFTYYNIYFLEDLSIIYLLWVSKHLKYLHFNIFT